MKKTCFIICFISNLANHSLAQTDSMLPADRPIPADTSALQKQILINNLSDSLVLWNLRTEAGEQNFQRWLIQHKPYFNMGRDTGILNAEKRSFQGKEIFFYMIIGLLLLFAWLKSRFIKYFNDLFRLFFRPALKKKQIREQLMQSSLPSLLFNGFFIISIGLYLCFLCQHFHLMAVNNFWLMFLYCCGILSAVYFIKFIGLKMAGWLFDQQELADSYIFIVFVVNKIIGILLLPFLVIIAFSTGIMADAGLVISYLVVGAMLLYRFALSFSAIRSEADLDLFHFLIYLSAFEIAPLFVLYKLFLLFYKISA